MGGSFVCSHVVDVLALFFFFPKSQVLLQELNDAFGVTEVVFLELIDLVEGGLEGVVSQGASARMILKHFIVED